jgi:hypothetical protein
MVVHRRSAGRSARSASSDVVPAPGTTVLVTTAIDDNGDLEEQGIDEQGDDNDGIDIEGKVLSVDQQARTLSVTADDDDDAQGGTLLVHVPDSPSFDMTKFTVGQDVELRATLQPDGSYLLVGSASDDNENEADDDNHQQGVQGEHGKVDTQGTDSHGDGSGDDD